MDLFALLLTGSKEEEDAQADLWGGLWGGGGGGLQRPSLVGFFFK